jgi:hypothetical protein
MKYRGVPWSTVEYRGVPTVGSESVACHGPTIQLPSARPVNQTRMSIVSQPVCSIELLPRVYRGGPSLLGSATHAM